MALVGPSQVFQVRRAGLTLEGDKIPLCHFVGKTKLKPPDNFFSTISRIEIARNALCQCQNGARKAVPMEGSLNGQENLANEFSGKSQRAQFEKNLKSCALAIL